ncbi:MAG TPA: hypothetical protein VN324_02470, partial [Quisquiliibacterium sp.]|nr:hypothetical protein [Quisquiliibacterium sp.]
MLNLRLFGPGVLELEGRAVRLHSSKALALLALLCVEAERPHGRARLASLLWGAYPEASARQSLRQALYSLKTCAGGRLQECIETGPDFVRFIPGNGLD